jgi:hypothetical protein
MEDEQSFVKDFMGVWELGICGMRARAAHHDEAVVDLAAMTAQMWKTIWEDVGDAGLSRMQFFLVNTKKGRSEEIKGPPARELYVNSLWYNSDYSDFKASNQATTAELWASVKDDSSHVGHRSLFGSLHKTFWMVVYWLKVG